MLMAVLKDAKTLESFFNNEQNYWQLSPDLGYYETSSEAYLRPC